MGRCKRTGVILTWVGALAAAFALDASVSAWLYERSFHLTAARVMRNTPWADAVKAIGDFRTVMVLAVLLMVFARMRWRKALIMLICAGTSVLGEVLKFVVGRARPLTHDRQLAEPYDFMPLVDRAAGMSFPSGHVLLAFATAVCLARYYPKWAPLAYSVAALVAAERVLELSHHLSDVVASCWLALLVTPWLVVKLENRLLVQQAPVKEEEEVAA